MTRKLRRLEEPVGHSYLTKSLRKARKSKNVVFDFTKILDGNNCPICNQPFWFVEIWIDDKKEDWFFKCLRCNQRWK